MLRTSGSSPSAMRSPHSSGRLARGRGRVRGEGPSWRGALSSNESQRYHDELQHHHGFRNNRYLSAGSWNSKLNYRPSRRGGGSDDYPYQSRQDFPPTCSSGKVQAEHRHTPDPVPRKRICSGDYSSVASWRSQKGNRMNDYGKSSCGLEDDGRPAFRKRRGSLSSVYRRAECHSYQSRKPSWLSSSAPRAWPSRVCRPAGDTIQGRSVTRVFTRTRVGVSVALRKGTFVEQYASKERSLNRSDKFESERGGEINLDTGDKQLDEENWEDKHEEDCVRENKVECKGASDEYSKEEIATRKKLVCKIVKETVRRKPAKQEYSKAKNYCCQKFNAKQIEDDQTVNVGEVVEEEKGGKNHNDVAFTQVACEQNSKVRAFKNVCKPTLFKLSPNMIRLLCPHCQECHVTIKDYHNHLRGMHHVNVMRKLSSQVKQNLLRMRKEQRIQQRLDEEGDELNGVTRGQNNHCQTCKLNYHQDQTKHDESDKHKKMKEFLTPTCEICRIYFRSPMLYKNHICSLEHVQVVARLSMNRDREHHTGKQEVKDNFLVLDFVGTTDEKGDIGKKSQGKDIQKKEKRKKAQINLGADYVKKVELMYCELCEIYLPWTGDGDVPLGRHCRSGSHLRRFIRYCDNQDSKEEVERIRCTNMVEQDFLKAKEIKVSQIAKAESLYQTDKVASNEHDPDFQLAKRSNDSLWEFSTDAADLVDKVWADIDTELDELLCKVQNG